MSEAAAAGVKLPARLAVDPAVVFIAIGMMATTLAQPEVLGLIPLQNLLKNELHLPRSATASFGFWMGLPWYMKPLAGILTDAFPLFGRRRSSYLLVSSILATAAWIALAFTAHRYGPLLWGCLALSACMVVTSTVIGAYMVETAQASASSGRLTAVRLFAMRSCLILSGPISGYLATLAFGWTAGISAAVIFTIVPATLLSIREERVEVRAGEVLAAAGGQLRRIAAARTMWAAAGLIALVFAAPGLTTALFYLQQNELHMTTRAQGGLRLIGGCAGVLAAVAYAWACQRWSLRRLLVGLLALCAAMSLTFLAYDSPTAARVITALYGFTLVLAETALLDLAIRATPKGSEGLGYALIVSVTNLAQFGTDWMGSAMMDAWHLPFWGLVLANAATTAIAAPLVFLLPASLVAAKDRESPEQVLDLAA